MTAYDTEPGLVLSQKPTKNKHGEMSVVRQMLDVINVKDSVITVDALHFQRDTLEKIAEKKAHVVVQVKHNQPKLRAAVVEPFQAAFDAGKEKIVTEIKEKHHGRSAARYVFQLKAKLSEALTKKWPTVRS